MPAPNFCISPSTPAPPRRWSLPNTLSKHQTQGPRPMETTTLLPTETLINELQSFGARLVDPKAGHESRRGGAGPSDHKALTIDGMTVMVPVHTAPAFESPYRVEKRA